MSDDDDCIIIEDNLNYKSISCENIPELFLDKLTAKKHFSKFGKINRFILRPKRLQCTVEFEKEEDAENAFVNAGTYNGYQFEIKYTTNEVAHTRNTEEWVDPDVQAELDAMGNSVRMLQSRGSAIMRNMAAPRIPKPILKPIKSSEGSSRVDGIMKSDLESILRRPAADAEDRYRILDARDKLIRLTTVRTTDIKKVVSIKGICPDMCPEKERLLRETKHQVSSFELTDDNRNLMDHRIAVKEYSRSSADQETPLTHELRPEKVLKMTMTYLMHRVMDLCDDPATNIGDWYHFVWDRTRSIRKDITQQELCSLGAVQLVEQCARFHIHCAARLIAEDASAFDQRINTENLTKCLQTLKYMYHDLRLKNVKCPNEGEFRAYVVLLNLSDANFLWEINQLPSEIQNSEEIRLALAVYLAMESNNYVKFFKLVRKTTYLNACILLRYFTQVRVKAIKTIMKAYNWPRHLVALPLKYLKEVLAFESVEAAVSLFTYYGLDCDTDNVFLDRKAFYIPDMPFFMERSLTVVEAKRLVTVGEIVCGQKLDSIENFNNHIPHNSFDEDGYLRPEAWAAEDQMSGTAKKMISKEPAKDPDTNLFKIPRASPPISPKQQNKSIFQLKSGQDNALRSQIQPIQPAPQIFSLKPSAQLPQSNTNGISKPLFPIQMEEVPEKIGTSNIFLIPALNKSAEKSIFGGTSKTSASTGGSLFGNNSFKSDETLQSDNIFKNFEVRAPSLTGDGSFFSSSANKTDQIVPHAPINSKQEKRQLEKIEKMRKKHELEEKLIKEKDEKKKLAALEKEKKLKEAEERKAEEKTKKEKLKEIRKEKIKMINKNAKIVWKEIAAAIQGEELQRIASDELTIYEKLVSESNDFLNELVEECLLEYLIEVIEDETSILTKNQKVLQKYFKMWRHNVLLKKERRKLIESTPVWLTKESLEEQTPNLAHPRQDETLQMMTRYRLGVSGSFDLKSPEREQIDIFSLLLPVFRGRCDSNDRGILKSRKYLKIILSIPLETEELAGFNLYFNSWLDKNIVRNSDKLDSDRFLCESRENLSLCIRKISGIISRNEKNIKVSTECDHSDALFFVMTCGNLLNSRRRLHHLLKLSQIYKPIPLTIVIYNTSAGDEFIISELELKKLVDDEKISSYTILGGHDRIKDEELRLAFQKGFKFLAKTYDDNYNVEMQQLSSFINLTLGNDFWSRLNETWMINPSFRKLCAQPFRVIEIYNEAIDRLVTLLDENYGMFPEFPEELKEFVPDLQCDIPLDLEYFPKDWKIEEKNFRIKKFVEKLRLKPFQIPELEISKLEISFLDYSTACIPNETDLARKAGYSAIKFLLEKLHSPDLLDLQISERMNFIPWLGVVRPIALGLLTSVWDMEYKYLPKEIIYRKSWLKDYLTIPWWLESNNLKAIKMLPAMDEEDESFLQPPDAKKSKKDFSDSSNLDDILAKGLALVEKADRNIVKFTKLTTIGREISRSFDMNLYKQEMAVRSMKRFIRENI